MLSIATAKREMIARSPQVEGITFNSAESKVGSSVTGLASDMSVRRFTPAPRGTLRLAWNPR